MDARHAAVAARAGARLAKRPLEWRMPSGGYSSALRLVVRFEDGSSAFVKVAIDEETAGWLRAEHDVYRCVRGSFLPELLAWDDDAEWPMLMLEDLSAAEWSANWTARRVDAVLATLRDVASTRPPDGMQSMEDWRESLSGWAHVAADPRPFLRLGLASEAWLRSALNPLVAAERSAVLAGDALLHNDVRSDNLCFLGERVIFVDWNWSRRGNPDLDLAAWAPSLHDEGGPPPEAILPNAPELAALVSGFYAAHAGLPPDGLMSSVRELQRRQLRTALPWAIRALGLPPMDGVLRGA